MRLEIFYQSTMPGIPSKTHFRQLIGRVARAIQKKCPSHISFAFVDDREMTKLNTYFLKRKGPTDILSFRGEGTFLGELVINLDELKRGRQLKEESLYSLVDRLVVHGVLSLFGLHHHGKGKITDLEDAILGKNA